MAYSKQRVLHTTLWLMVIVLLIITASRIRWINQLVFGIDESRAILRTFGTPAEIISWQPADWPPLHALFLGLWEMFVGLHPGLLRYSSVLLNLLAVTLAYRAGYALFQKRAAAWGTLLVYAGLGYSVFLGTFLRGYSISLAFFPLALWLTIRYFRQSNWRRALLLALALVIMFYSTYTSVFAFAIIGFYTLLLYRWQIWRWWRPALLALPLALPEILRKYESIMADVATTYAFRTNVQHLTGEAMQSVYQEYAGNAAAVWLIIFIGAVILIAWKGRFRRLQLVWLLVWTLVAPTLAYTTAVVNLRTRYIWWVLLGFALLIGAAFPHLSRIPRIGRLSQILLAGFMLVGMFDVPMVYYQHDIRPPYETTFNTLRRYIQPGDVLIIDPKCNTHSPDALAYYLYAFFDNKLPVVKDPTDYRRVWYLHTDTPGWYDEETFNAVVQGRVPGLFVGPWNFLVRLYELPPDVEGIPFENGLRFHGVDVLDGSTTANPPYYWWEEQTARIRLWWSVDHPLEADYAIGLYLINGDETLITQLDGPPQVIDPSQVNPPPETLETSQMRPKRYYIDERYLTLPERDTRQDAVMRLSVYQWWDSVRLAAPGADNNQLLRLFRVTVFAW